MPDDRQTAASLWSIRRERSDDHVPAGRYRVLHACGVVRTVARIGQEMKGGSVVPKIVAFIRTPGRHICDNPGDVLGARSEPVPRRSQCFFRDIEDGDRAKAFGNKGIDQARRTTSNINNRRVST